MVPFSVFMCNMLNQKDLKHIGPVYAIVAKRCCLAKFRRSLYGASFASVVDVILCGPRG